MGFYGTTSKLDQRWSFLSRRGLCVKIQWGVLHSEWLSGPQMIMEHYLLCIWKTLVPWIMQTPGGASFRLLGSYHHWPQQESLALGSWWTQVPKFKFPKFKFSLQNSNSVMDNKHCQLFPFKWPSLFIFEKMLANIPLNNRSGFEWRHINTVSVETVVLLPACWLWEKCQCLKNRLTRELNWKNQTDGWLYLKNDWNEEIMEFMWFRPTSPHAWSSPVATAPFHPCLSEVFFFFF